MDHVVIRKLEHLSGTSARPALGYAVETRERPGPAHKKGAFPGDIVWVQLFGGLYVAKAQIEICWVGEYSSVAEVRARTRGSSLAALNDFWRGRSRYGYAAVASLQSEHWIEPFWAGPRTYGYEWVLLEDERKRASWLDHKEPPRTGAEVAERFQEWKAAR